MRHYIKLFGIIAAVFFSGYFLELVSESAREHIEIFTEILIVFVAFSIFTMTWYAYGKSRDNHSLFLGATFLNVGVLSLLHIFSLSFMPDFITSNSPQKAELFWGEAMIFLAIFILASVYIYHDSLPGFINRPVLLILSIFIALLSIIPVLFFLDHLVPMFISGNRASSGMLLLLAAATVMTLYAIYLYARRLKRTGQKNIQFLMDGLIIVTVSNFVYFSYEFSGHLLMATGFYFIHLSLYRSSVELPYEKLAEAEDRLRKDAEEKLKQTMAELMRSNKELEEFAYVASHDLQEPLRMVVSYLQLIEKRYKSRIDADADEFIDFAVDGATRMQRLINDLLTYSRVGTQGRPFVPTDCESVLRQACANLEIAMKESGAVITHDVLPEVMADSGQLAQLFQNLIGNAIKFRNEKPPEIHIGIEQKGNDWLFCVRDHGIGIDMQYAERIFHIFQRLHGKKEYSGSGIGLAVCKKIVKRHGGRIWVESEPGKGSTFYFTIPKERGERI
ncbi:MAG TPA: ATP-binding protein [Candidatus Methanoperedens sp.]|nr:ATP-binding protein [Candidatus Methanoperedens sp.]HLB70066.1 ATP-binding protein [Candidatus Methanoperedens sp.]